MLLALFNDRRLPYIDFGACVAKSTIDASLVFYRHYPETGLSGTRHSTKLLHLKAWHDGHDYE